MNNPAFHVREFPLRKFVRFVLCVSFDYSILNLAIIDNNNQLFVIKVNRLAEGNASVCVFLLLEPSESHPVIVVALAKITYVRSNSVFVVFTDCIE